ncbi:hypothetical protein BDB00DRAFT_755882 [Zychaea mexicana]|uniref:uncharacterized protein n=1 Tax=Zychaea mexicana TaxID=64656 RepID=UPI0022FDB401|nr:uncharacterized protein BDB00DRAFT_755882 [Zychaea mexicana]KAI9497813.1 hypothetical protein BDB00DRAFT_755882 [Zychaea mexicana]
MQWIQKTKNDLGSTSSLHLDKTMLRDALETHTRKLLRKLSKTGHNMGEPGISDAQFLLASCHGSGALGLVYDPAKACAWYIQASKQNHREAIYRAGVCHELGLGTRQDFGRAIAYYQRGARLSHSTCMYKLGVILLHGYYKHAPQARLGVSWIQRAADSIAQALPYAMHALAMVQLTGECDKTSLIPDTTYALQLLHRAAKMGYEASQCKLAEFYETGTWVEVDDVKSISWYTNAAKQGNPQAALGLSGWYLTGSNTPGVLPQSDRESYLWAKRAANAPIEARDYYAGEKPIELAVANGCYLVGYYSENGIGVARDTSTEEAVLWYRKAACLGHRLAMRRLKALAPTQEDTESSHTSRRRRRKTECLIM